LTQDEANSIPKNASARSAAHAARKDAEVRQQRPTNGIASFRKAVRASTISTFMCSAAGRCVGRPADACLTITRAARAACHHRDCVRRRGANHRRGGASASSIIESSAGTREGQNVWLNAKDDAGNFLVGFRGEVHFQWLFVNILFVEESQRGKGIGTRLLAEGEAHGRNIGALRSRLKPSTGRHRGLT